MSEIDGYSARHELLQVLMEKTGQDAYPSATMLDMIEDLLTPDDVPAYTRSLMARIQNDRFPSISLIHRVQNFA